jgi:glycosyltransferase involved in cell wall biosynthesis
VRGAPPPPEWDTYRRRVADGLRAASAVVVLTPSGGRDLADAYGVDAVTCIANGRSGRWVHVRAKEPIVLGAGRLWDEAKNLAALDRAAGRLEWPVLVCGDAPPERPRNAQLLGRVSQDELAERLARATVFAAPARYEPFGLAALEAGLAGCALVLGDIASLREVWGDAALYVDPDDDAALAAAIALAMDDPAYGEAARKRAALYTPERLGTRYLAAYETLAAAALDAVEAAR